MIYVNNKLQAKSRSDLMTTKIEMLWLETYALIIHSAHCSLLMSTDLRHPRLMLMQVL